MDGFILLEKDILIDRKMLNSLGKQIKIGRVSNELNPQKQDCNGSHNGQNA